MQRLTNNAMCHLRNALRRSAGIVRALPAVVYGAWIAGCFCGCGPAGDDPESRPGTAQTRVIREDAVLKEIGAFRNETRSWYNSSRFDDLEKRAAELRASKAIFGNGRWKIQRFYDSLECSDEEQESMWQLHERIHLDWIAKKPASITARVAYADFLVSYAWHARGEDVADKVTPEGWKLFRARLAAAHAGIDEARKMPEKDPYVWTVALAIALGEGPERSEYDALVEQAHASEPMFWSYDTARAFSLLPRWYGKPGDWEHYALAASARGDGVGVETYTRIVMYLMGRYGNIFTETQASWPKTREGFEQMLKKYPESEEVVQFAAILSSFAGDREFAQPLFKRMGDTCLLNVWGSQKRFEYWRKWAAGPQGKMGP